MRKYLLFVALLATSNAFAWSVDAHVSNKPVCDRMIDLAPAKPVALHADAVIAHQDGSTSPSMAATGNAVSAPAAKNDGAGFGRARNAPRWQSFLPGMFK